MKTLYVALGSNKGNRIVLLKRALDSLSRTIGSLIKCSSFYETKPEGFQSDALFLNAVAAFSTKMEARQLLQKTQEIERQLGRTHKSINHVYTDRCIDIDLLMLDNEIIKTKELIIPHPEMHRRSFVLTPFVEIAPYAIHPVIKKTMKEISKNMQEEIIL